MNQSEFDASKWLFIINPNAGNGRGERDWPVIRELIDKTNIPYTHVMTQARGHAIDLVQEHIPLGFRRIIVVGGDGTLNEVLNGIMNQQEVPVEACVLGMIPVGTGNDWCRMFHIPFDYPQAIAILQRGKTFVQDIGKVTYTYHDQLQVRYFMNVAGMGYDALVAKKTNLFKEKGRGGPFTYLYFVFASLLQYRFMDMVIEIDGKILFKGDLFSMNIGICKYNGGGMMQVPYAIPDDGLMDVTLIKRASKLVVIRHVKKLYNGSHIALPMVETFRGKVIRIRSTGKIYLETDGESLGHSPFTYEILPTFLRVITGDFSYEEAPSNHHFP